MILHGTCIHCRTTTEYTLENGDWLTVQCTTCGKFFRIEPQTTSLVMLPKPSFTHQDDLFLLAAELGCTPVLEAIGWLCKCKGAQHGACTSYPIINSASLERFKAGL